MITDLEKIFKSFSIVTDQMLNSSVTRNTKVNEYTFPTGKAIGFDLYTEKENRIAVQRVFIPKNVTFLFHHHVEREWYIVYHGRVVIKFDSGEEKILVAGDSYYFEPTQGHESKALEDTELICVTIPASITYPGVGNV